MRILSTPQLVSLNNKAIRNQASRTLTSKAVAHLDDGGVHHVIHYTLIDDVGTIRALLMLAGTHPVEGILDMDVKDFLALPEAAEVPDDAA